MVDDSSLVNWRLVDVRCNDASSLVGGYDASLIGWWMCDTSWIIVAHDPMIS